jgi:SAM-dependent methyltransferase
VYSSHCLEHLADPWRAVRRWWEVLRPGGHLLLVVPDEDLYEQGCWPSRFNTGHRWTFTIDKSRSWSPVSINLAQLVAQLPARHVIWLRTCDDGYEYAPGCWDRTQGPAEAHIECLVRKLGEGC